MKIYREIPLEVTITYYSPARPGRTSGSPESCYPPEDAEIEFVLKTPGGKVLDESDFPSESDWQEIATEILETHEGEIQDAHADAEIDNHLARHRED